MLLLVVEKAIYLIFYKIFVIIYIESDKVDIMIKEILTYFYCPMDDYKNYHCVSYNPDVTRKEIADDLEHSFGNIMIIKYEEIFEY